MKDLKPFDAQRLLKSVQAGTATPDEARLALDLTEAIQVVQAQGAATPEQLAILKAADLIEGDEEDVEAAPAPEAAATVAPAAAAPEATPVRKNVDLPDPNAIMQAVAAAGASLDMSPILMEANASYARVAKALEIQNDLLDENNALLAQIVAGQKADSAALVSVTKGLTTLTERVEGLTTPDENGEVTILKALQPHIGSGLQNALQGLQTRVGDVEQVLHRRPMPSNPSRGGGRGVPVLKGLGANSMDRNTGDILLPVAIEMIRKAVNLDKMEKSQALQDVQTALSENIPLANVLMTWHVVDPAQAG